MNRLCTMVGIFVVFLAACSAPSPFPAIAPTVAEPTPGAALEATAAPVEATQTPLPLPTQTVRPSSTPTPLSTLATLPVQGQPVPGDLPAEQAAIWISWRSGPHANAYGLDKGPNTYCARCHSPTNWDSASKIDPPPNCVSCKFANDPEVRVAEHNRLVPESEWKSIGCEVCHQTVDGEMLPGMTWWDQDTGQYHVIDSSDALCGKCHADTETLRHRRDLGEFAHRGFTCVNCHDPHSASANCTAVGCHEGLASAATPPAGHDSAHAQVACVACHDASGLEAGLDKATGAWITWRTTELLGRKSTNPYLSHSLQRQVDCARCHFAGNGWGLPVDVE